MKGSEHHLQGSAVLRTIFKCPILKTGFYKCGIDLLVYGVDQFGPGIELCILVTYGLNLLYNSLVVRGHQLSTIPPIHLISVVFRRVVGCGQYDPAMTIERLYGKGKFRCRA